MGAAIPMFTPMFPAITSCLNLRAADPLRVKMQAGAIPVPVDQLYGFIMLWLT
jgi:hypothetical protein